jgi:hypothetical protein
MNKVVEWKKYLSEHQYIGYILRGMLDSVNSEESIYDIKPWTKNWFMKYSWTTLQQEDFSDWLKEYLYNNTRARQEFLRTNVRTKQYISRAVSEFVFLYGWKVKK